MHPTQLKKKKSSNKAFYFFSPDYIHSPNLPSGNHNEICSKISPLFFLHTAVLYLPTSLATKSEHVTEFSGGEYKRST